MANGVTTSDTAGTGTVSDNDKFLSALGYQWWFCCLPLFLVPMFAAKESKFAQFHARQAAMLYIAAIGGAILMYIVSFAIGIAAGIIGIPVIACIGTILYWGVMAVFFVVAILGAINALQMQEKDLPVLGPFAVKLPF